MPRPAPPRRALSQAAALARSVQRLRASVLAIAQVRGNIGERIECASGPFAGDARNRAQAFHDALAALGVFREHHWHAVHASAHGFQRGVLRDRGRVRCGLALHLGHRLNQRFRRKRIANAPSSHRKRFGDGADDDDVLFRILRAGDRERLVRLVDEMRIAFVAHQPNAMFVAERQNALELFRIDHTARGIARRIDDHHFRFWRDGFLNVGCLRNKASSPDTSG